MVLVSFPSLKIKFPQRETLFSQLGNFCFPGGKIF